MRRLKQLVLAKTPILRRKTTIPPLLPRLFFFLKKEVNKQLPVLIQSMDDDNYAPETKI